MSASRLTIRSAAAGDAARIQAIYAPIVESTPISFEEVPPTVEEMATRISDTLARGYPYLVAERAGEVAGYAYSGQHRARPAYRWSVEVSVYVSDVARRSGVGRALYAALFPMLAERGFHAALAGVTLPNPASVALHEAMGFRPVGVFREIGFKFGRWHDVGWWERFLAS